MNRDIVVGLDGSPASSRALAWAVEEARRSRCVVRAMHVWSTPVWLEAPGFGYGVLPSPDELEAGARAVLAQQVSEFREQHDTGGVELRPSTRHGDPKRELVDEAQDAALLVVGSRGAGALRGLLMGSVTFYALHHASCPVMVVPDPGSPSLTLQRVIVGADGSEASRSAMRWALASARQHGCPLVVMHAWLLPTLPSSFSLPVTSTVPDFGREAEEWLDKELHEVLPDRQDVRVSHELVYGAASWALLDKAGPDDQLVLGHRGRGGFAELLLGSVASQCAHHARGVLVVVHPDDRALDSG